MAVCRSRIGALMLREIFRDSQMNTRKHNAPTTAVSSIMFTISLANRLHGISMRTVHPVPGETCSMQITCPRRPVSSGKVVYITLFSLSRIVM